MPLGASWVSRGCLWVSPGCLWVFPGCLLCSSWVPPGCLLGASWAPRVGGEPWKITENQRKLQGINAFKQGVGNCFFIAFLSPGGPELKRFFIVFVAPGFGGQQKW